MPLFLPCRFWPSPTPNCRRNWRRPERSTETNNPITDCPRRITRFCDPADVAEAQFVLREILSKDGVWVAPSDTIYGISGNATSAHAADRIRSAKKRADKPFIYLVSNMEMACRFVESRIPSEFADLFESGHLTLVLVSRFAPWGRTAALRVATDPLAQSLVRDCGIPLISTSANLSDTAYVDDPDEIYRTFRTSVDLMIDGGPLGRTMPSTVLDLTGAKPVILREGKMAQEVRDRLA